MQTKSNTKHNRPILGMIITLFSALMIVATSAAKIALPKEISTLEVLVYMNIVSLILFFLLLLVTKTSFKVFHPKQVLLRAAMGFIGVYLFFYAYELGLSLSAGIVLSQLTPLFSVVGMVLIVKEGLHKKEGWLLGGVLLLAFVGVIIIANPFQTNSLLLPVLVGVAAGVLSGFTVVVIRSLMFHHRPEVVSFYNSLFVVVVGCSILIITRNMIIYPPSVYIGFILVGTFNTFAVFSMALAAFVASPTKTAPYAYTAVVFAPIVQYVLFQTVVEVQVILGGLLIVGMNFIHFYGTMKKKKKIGENHEKEESLT